MKLLKNLVTTIFLLTLTLLLVVPTFAHGEDPEEGEPSTQVADEGDGHDDDDPHTEDEEDHSGESDAHTEEGDSHNEDGDHGHTDGEDNHGDGSGNTGFVIGGIIGAVLLAAGAAFMFSPRPSMLVLIGLALIGATGVIHLMVGANWGDTLLLLNGIGFLGLGVVWAIPNQMIPNQKRIVAIVLAVYTLITILGYFLTHDHYDFVAILTKVIEVPLLIILAISVFSSEKINTDLEHG
ncbi:MAG: hypothetical protein AB8G95_08490 [Anaerolineae bacterium]